jgi:Glycerophosphoryl diester phosphodiesterase family
MGNNCAMSCHINTIRYSRASPIGCTTLGRWLLIAAALARQACAISLDVRGHRGTRGLAPENTLAAFDRALKVGVSTLELDIAITADKVAVISLDPALLEFTTRDASGRWRNVMQYVELALPAANTAPQLSGLPG